MITDCELCVAGGFEFVDPGMHELEGEPTSQQQASGVAVLVSYHSLVSSSLLVD